MDIKQLSQQLDNLQNQPPFEKWHPPYCGEMPIEIKTNGDWFYMGTPISRVALVKLFASVLVKEQHEYFLKTPAEKVKIQVENVPFIITEWQHETTSEGFALVVTSNLGHRIVVDEQHPIIRKDDEKLYVNIVRGLEAEVHRNVFYQWVEIAKQEEIDGKSHMIITSGNKEYSIGSF